MLNPRTAVRGAWFWWSFLSWQSSFTLLHGLYEVGNLAIYAAAAWAVADGKNG
ncbi:MAG: hypothetical protein WB616_09000 [Candidatus Sulfotelmatobacter sp.]|jgi:hypothetical protein